MNVCAICLDEVDEADHRTFCNHQFHKPCLAAWVDKNATCPMCRAPCVIELKLRYRVWSPRNEDSWCSSLERLLNWYVTFRDSNIVLVSYRGTRITMHVRRVKEARILGDTVTVIYAAESNNGPALKTLALCSSNPAQRRRQTRQVLDQVVEPERCVRRRLR